MEEEILIAEEYLFQKLKTGIGALVNNRIYPNAAPEDSAYPLVIFQFIDGSETQTIDGTRVISHFQYLVKAAVKGTSLLPLKSIVKGITDTLHRSDGVTTQTPGRVISCLRDKPFNLPTVEDGNNYRQLGAFYLLDVQPTTS